MTNSLPHHIGCRSDGASADILTDIEDRVLSPSSGIRSKEVSKLLQPEVLPFPRGGGDKSEGNKSSSLWSGRLRSWDNLNKADVSWSAEAEDMETALKSFMEATSWIDWWTFVIKSLSLKSAKDTCLVRRLSLAGARCQLLVAKTASTLWANVILKRRHTVLVKVKGLNFI